MCVLFFAYDSLFGTCASHASLISPSHLLKAKKLKNRSHHHLILPETKFWFVLLHLSQHTCSIHDFLDVNTYQIFYYHPSSCKLLSRVKISHFTQTQNFIHFVSHNDHATDHYSNRLPLYLSILLRQAYRSISYSRHTWPIPLAFWNNLASNSSISRPLERNDSCTP